jgi:hypothetical protein
LKINRSILVVLFILFIAGLAPAGELDDARSQLVAVQAKLAEERALYLAAKAAMERSEVVAQFYFPELQKREKELLEKIAQIEAKGKTEKDKK